MKGKASTVSECNKAAAGLNGKAVVVDVDLDDQHFRMHVSIASIPRNL